MKKQQRSLFEQVEEPDAWELDDEADRLVATVVLPDAPFGPFDYLVPEVLRARIEPGGRVSVPFGKGNRKVVAYCVRVGPKGPPSVGRKFAMKEVAALVDERPLLTPSMLRLTEWMAGYYLCPWGQVLEAVVPAGVRGQAGTREVVVLRVPPHVKERLAELDLPAKQARILQHVAAASKPLTVAEICAATKTTSAPLTALRKKGLLEAQRQRVYQHEQERVMVSADEPPVLNPPQQTAVAAALEALRGQRHETILLYGVTGSGKTEVYMRAIQEVVSYGRQAIVLVPEISLTPQTVSRFRARFERVSVLHSHLTPQERHWHWRRIAAGETDVVVGARSAVFAPAPQLGLIVLDEEHDASFKQDSAPRYHARDVARWRAEAARIPLVLGSATPSLESWQAAAAQQFRLIELPQRVLDRALPDVGIIDLRSEYQNPYQRGAISRPLQQAMQLALREGGQVILLLNRRGFSTSIQCPACGNVVRCPDCDISLTHHRTGEKAVCHYCDYQMVPPPVCPDCGFEGIRYSGLGTQRLEAEVRSRFPEASCLRMDSDTMQKSGSHETAFARFRSGEVQILLGTQMISKGLDFPNVTLVGVVNADTALHFPDFRAAERTFQLVTQVAGRTGRGERGGRVLVQTFSPEHPAIQAARRHDYRTFAAGELADRQDFGYPPATRMVRIILRSESEAAVEAVAQELGRRVSAILQASDETRVLGPAPAPLAKLRGRYRYHLLAFAPQGDLLRQAVAQATAELRFPDEVQWVVDVDPLDML